jgi:hypothetical protein
MVIRRIALVLLSLTLAQNAFAAEKKQLLAVLPLDTTRSKMDEASKSTFEEAIRTIAGDELGPSGFTILTGENTLQVLADNNVDVTKVCESSCALDAARELKAQLFISGTVANSEGDYVAFVRLFEIKSGQQIASVHVEGPTVKELRQKFRAAAPEFFAKVRAPRRALAGRILHIQIDDDYFKDPVEIETTQNGETRKCPKVSFGFACQLSMPSTGTTAIIFRDKRGEITTASYEVPEKGAHLRLEHESVGSRVGIFLGGTLLLGGVPGLAGLGIGALAGWDLKKSFLIPFGVGTALMALIVIVSDPNSVQELSTTEKRLPAVEDPTVASLPATSHPAESRTGDRMVFAAGGRF